MITFDCFYGVTVLQLILRDSENLSKILQKSALTSCQREEIADLTLQTITSLRSKQAEVLEVAQPSLPRKWKRPAKLLNENEVSLFDGISGVKTFYRRIYFEIITRFSQPGCRTIRNIEQLHSRQILVPRTSPWWWLLGRPIPLWCHRVPKLPFKALKLQKRSSKWN